MAGTAVEARIKKRPSGGIRRGAISFNWYECSELKNEKVAE